ncbi:HNH endonuclease signature motif containing protein [Streptomyces rochei]|uniref:HNH endonuclease signature motif containing protein n=1 Tax=Streptomyces rochei TaxID=1928 RepID=UPI0033AD8A7D
MATAWLVMAAGDNRKHGGNGGYDDLPSEHYSWDSAVPNHGRPAAGDVIAVWDKKSLLGISVIEDIDTGEGVKEIYNCPNPACGKSDFQPRKTVTPKYACLKCGHRFDVPVSGTKPVVTYRSRHGAAWVDMPGILSGDELRSLCDKPRTQHSIRSMRWERLRDAITATGTPTTVDIADSAQRAITGGHKRVSVRARVGQTAFRLRLLKAQGESCAFTGPAPAAALEAAHLYSYAATGEHHTSGGLLLRRDIHRLFDLGLITVRPDEGTLDVAGQLAQYPLYAQIHGTRPTVQLRPQHRPWLRTHWELHRTHGQAASSSVPQTSQVLPSHLV